MATAHAKARLSNKVEARDADVAIELIRFACYKKVEVKEKRTRKIKEALSDEEEEEELEEETEAEQNKKGLKKTPPTKRPHGGSEEDDDEEEEEEEEEEPQPTNEELERQPKKRTRRKTQLESQSQTATNKASFPILTSEK